MPRPICVKCGKYMPCSENGVVFVEYAGDPGNNWPYSIVRCDAYKCKICGVEVLSGFGKKTYLNGDRVSKHVSESIDRVIHEGIQKAT